MDGRRLQRFEVEVPRGVEPELFALRFMAIEGIKPSFQLIRKRPSEEYIQKYSYWYHAYGGSYRTMRRNAPVVPWIHLKVPQRKSREFKELAKALQCRLKRRDRRRKK